LTKEFSIATIFAERCLTIGLAATLALRAAFLASVIGLPVQVTMDITEDQTPSAPRPPIREKGGPSKDKPDTGSSPDLINPEEPDEDGEPVDPLPDMDPDGQDPVEDETVN